MTQEKDDSYIKEQKELRRKLLNLIAQCEQEKLQEEDKQNTLEESAENWVKNRFAKQICGDESYPDIYASKEAIVQSHIIFAKWQQEQEKMYSKEDVITILESLVEHPTKPGYKRGDILKVIEQVKKK